MKQISMFEDFEDNQNQLDEWAAFICPVCNEANCMGDECIYETVRRNKEKGLSNEPDKLRNIWGGHNPYWVTHHVPAHTPHDGKWRTVRRWQWRD